VGRNNVKNLEAIEELDPVGNQRSRVGAMVLASFGGACIVLSALVLMRSPEPEKVAAADPLGDLVNASKGEGADGTEKLKQQDVTFPSVLTDQDNPTTAMEVVRGGSRGPDPDTAELPRAPMAFDGPPPATDRLPVVPLPAQDMLGALPKSDVSPSDKLRNIATSVARETDDGTVAEAGTPGGYQLQVSSFKKKEDADNFAMALRRRGHKAYVQKAHVKGRGVWHRVRIGPFRYKRSAKIYRQDFEAKERMVTFIVNPPKTRIHIAPADEG
jgi:cell division septation protein DedD